jgi:hypothetical protein
MRRAFVAVMITPAWMIVGCDSRPHPPDARTVIDSAGVEIVQLPWLQPDPATAGVQPDPLTVIGAAVAEQSSELYRVVGAARLSDERIVVANAGTNELRIFGSAGQFLNSAGRNGEGPGEFRSISSMVRLGGDTIAVYDARLQRISVFDHSGAFVRAHAIVGAVLPYVIGVGGKQSLIAWQFAGTSEERPGVYSVPAEFGHIDLPSGRFSAIGFFHSSEEARVWYRGSLARAFRPLGSTSDVAAGHGLTFVLSSTDSRSIYVYDLREGLKRILRIQTPAQRMSPAIVNRWVDSWVAAFSSGSEELERWWRAGFEELDPPAEVPVFRSLVADREGNVCGQHYPTDWVAAALFSCFTPEGRFVRHIRLPPGLRRPSGPHPHLDPRLEIGRDYVLGVWETDLGTEQVRLYAIADVATSGQ